MISDITFFPGDIAVASLSIGKVVRLRNHGSPKPSARGSEVHILLTSARKSVATDSGSPGSQGSTFHGEQLMLG